MRRKELIMFKFFETLSYNRNRKRIAKEHRETMKFLETIYKNSSIDDQTREKILSLYIDVSNERLKMYDNR